MIRRLGALLLILAAAAWCGRDVWPDGQAQLSTILSAGVLLAFGFWLLDAATLERFATWAIGTLRGVKKAAEP